MPAIRAYERTDLPIEERLPSLARRFPSLKGADGISPWDAERFSQWVDAREKFSPAHHTGVLLLNLAAYQPCETFDVLAALRVWEESDRQMFISLMRIWTF